MTKSEFLAQENVPEFIKEIVASIRSICDKGVQLPKKADYADFVL